jgi:transcriptional regulator with XRE-family HTH domain
MRQKAQKSGAWDTAQRQAFGAVIREARKTRYESQEAFATAVEVAPPYISQIESGRRVPSDELLCSMARLIPNAVDWNALRLEAHRLRTPQDLANLLTQPESVPEIFKDRLFMRLRRELEGSALPKEKLDKLIEYWLGEIKVIKSLVEEQKTAGRSKGLSAVKGSG